MYLNDKSCMKNSWRTHGTSKSIPCCRFPLLRVLYSGCTQSLTCKCWPPAAAASRQLSPQQYRRHRKSVGNEWLWRQRMISFWYSTMPTRSARIVILHMREPPLDLLDIGTPCIMAADGQIRGSAEWRSLHLSLPPPPSHSLAIFLLVLLTFLNPLPSPPSTLHDNSDKFTTMQVNFVEVIRGK